MVVPGYFMAILQKIKTSMFLRNVSVVLVGAVIAQMITVGSMPVLTRLYSTEAFGVFGLFMTIVGLFSTISTGRYNMAVMLPKENADASLLVALSIKIALIVGLCLLFLVLFGEQIAAMLGMPVLASVIVWVPLVVVINGWFQTYSNWSSRNKDFKVIALAAIFATLVGNALRMLFGGEWSSATGLVLGSFLIFLIQLLVLFGFGKNRLVGSSKLNEEKKQRTRELVRKYSQFPKFRAPKDLLNSLSQNSPTFMLTLFFSVDKVGQFYLVDRVLRAPSVLLGNAVRKVYFQKAAEIHNNGKSLLSSVLKLTFLLAVIGFVPFLFVIIWGDQIFGFVFGEEWKTAGEYARWLAVSMFFMFINVPSVVAIPVVGLEKYFLIYEISSIALRLLALFAGGYYLENDRSAIALYALAAALLNVALIIFVATKIKSMEVRQANG